MGPGVPGGESEADARVEGMSTGTWKSPRRDAIRTINGNPMYRKTIRSPRFAQVGTYAVSGTRFANFYRAGS